MLFKNQEKKMEAMQTEMKQLHASVQSSRVEKSGAWYSHGDERIGQGRENAKQYLRDNPDIAYAIEDKIRASHGLDFGVAGGEDEKLTED